MAQQCRPEVATRFGGVALIQEPKEQSGLQPLPRGRLRFLPNDEWLLPYLSATTALAECRSPRLLLPAGVPPRRYLTTYNAHFALFVNYCELHL